MQKTNFINLRVYQLSELLADEIRMIVNNCKYFGKDTVSFCIYRKNVFEKIGIFNEKMVRHQDYDFNYRLRKAGGHILLLPSAIIKYYVRSTITSLWKQFWEYGIWKGRFVRKHPDSLRLRHFFPPTLIFILILGGLLSIFFPLVTWTFTFAAVAYGIFILGANFFYLLKGKLKFLPALTIVLPTMHLGWGLGFWKGLFMKKLD
jgi:GT2 family glycosyltransferase